MQISRQKLPLQRLEHITPYTTYAKDSTIFESSLIFEIPPDTFAIYCPDCFDVVASNKCHRFCHHLQSYIANCKVHNVMQVVIQLALLNGAPPGTVQNEASPVVIEMKDVLHIVQFCSSSTLPDYTICLIKRCQIKRHSLY